MMNKTKWPKVQEDNDRIGDQSLTDDGSVSLLE